MNALARHPTLRVPEGFRAQARIDKFLVENVEKAYPDFTFSYDKASRTDRKSSVARPDVLIKAVRNNSGKKIIWLETDEWQHSSIPAQSEVTRENGTAKNLVADQQASAKCQIHLIRCSPYEMPQRSGIDHLDDTYTFHRILDCCRLVLDLLENKHCMPDRTFPLGNGSKLYLYYLNYTPDRIAELDRARERYLGIPSQPATAGSDLGASASPAAEQSQQRAHAHGEHSHEASRAHASGPSHSGLQQQQQQSTASSLEPASAPAVPSHQGASAQPSKQMQPKQSRPPKPVSTPAKHSAAHPGVTTGAPELQHGRSAPDLSTDIGGNDPAQDKVMCPYCSMASDCYIQEGDQPPVRNFTSFKLNDKPCVTIEWCRHCAASGLAKPFHDNCKDLYKQLHSKLEETQVNPKRCQELVSQVLEKYAKPRFKSRYKGKDLYKSNHPPKLSKALSRLNSSAGTKSEAGGIGGDVSATTSAAQAGQQTAAKPANRQPSVATSSAAAAQAASLGMSSAAALQQSNAAAAQTKTLPQVSGRSAEQKPTVASAGLASKKRPHDSMQHGTGDSTASKKVHTSHQAAEPLHGSATASRGHAGMAPKEVKQKAQPAMEKVSRHCPCCGKTKTFWDGSSNKRFIGNDISTGTGDSAKINICEGCHRGAAKEPFVQGCKSSYTLRKTPSMDSLSTLRRVLQESSTVHDDFKQACKGKDPWIENNPPKRS